MIVIFISKVLYDKDNNSWLGIPWEFIVNLYLLLENCCILFSYFCLTQQ